MAEAHMGASKSPSGSSSRLSLLVRARPGGAQLPLQPRLPTVSVCRWQHQRVFSLPAWVQQGAAAAVAPLAAP